VNVAKNVPTTRTSTKVDVGGYVWGTDSIYSTAAYGKVAGKLEKYDKIILADCLWMQSQHANLVKTIAQALNTEPGCCAIVVASFHTGRGIVRDFFDVATGELYDEGAVVGPDADAGTRTEVDGNAETPKLKIEEIYEVDVDGQKRDWERVRPGEVKEEAKRWCVVAILAQR